MSTDHNTRRLLDELELLRRANDVQLQTFDKYRKRNAALQRRVDRLEAMVGKVGIQSTKPLTQN